MGFTELTLLFIWYLENELGIKNNIIQNIKKEYLNWLHTTSGYYDNKIIYSHMNVDYKNYDFKVYNEYIKNMIDTIRKSDHFEFNISNILAKHPEINNFKKYLNINKTGFIDYNLTHTFIDKSNLLIISPFAELIQKQIKSGNCEKIFNDFPKLKNINIYTNPYTFFNQGPDNNILETAKKIISDINNLKYTYDTVLISCGAYGILLANEMIKINKNVIMLGGFIQPYFGIYNNRLKTCQINRNVIKNFDINDSNKDNWILEIPDKYKPKNYELIENGCYW